MMPSFNRFICLTDVGTYKMPKPPVKYDFNAMDGEISGETMHNKHCGPNRLLFSSFFFIYFYFVGIVVVVVIVVDEIIKYFTIRIRSYHESTRFIRTRIMFMLFIVPSRSVDSLYSSFFLCI